MEKRQHRQKEVLMTEGPIWRCLLLFALPLMAGNLFQQLYNTVDSIVVGNFVGKEALAAVGSTDSVINTFIGFFSGMSTGAGVIISQYYGGKKEEKVSVAVQTTIALTLCMSILCTVLALLLVPSLLRLMGTPEDVFPEAATYLRIYFIGVTGLLFYNMGAGILRAVGDSRRPLYFLIFCAVLNTLLDLLFVAVLRFGIAGCRLGDYPFPGNFRPPDTLCPDPRKSLLPHHLEQGPSGSGHDEKDFLSRTSRRNSDGSHFLFQCFCTGIHQSFWFCCHGRLVFLWKN